jgi:nucleoside-diphosphate-sugar epimerase
MGDVGQIIPTPYHIRHKASVEKAVSRSNVVVNLVGKRECVLVALSTSLLTVALLDYDTKNFTIEEANLESARTIVEACAKAPNVKRVIYVSSVSSQVDVWCLQLDR